MTAPNRRRVEPGIFERLAPDGRRLGLEIRWKSADGMSHRRSVQGGIRDARDALAQARTRRVRYEREPRDPRATLGAVIDRYEQVVLPGLRPRSRVVYRAAFNRARPVLGSRRVTAIGRAELRAFVTSLSGLKANTVRSYVSALRAVWTFAAHDLEIPVTFPKLKLPNPADDQREHRVLNDDELARLLAACEPEPQLLFRTLAETGARVSEVLGLRPRRIGEDTLTFREQLARTGRWRRSSRRTAAARSK